MSNHAIPMGNPHTDVLVTMSAFTYKKLFILAVQGIENADL